MPILNVNEVDIHYSDVGQGEVLVLLHGLGSSNKDWNLQIPVLSQYFRVIAPDFRAHGLSTKIPNQQGVPTMMEDIVQLLQKLNIDKASFVGFSRGGAVTFQLALDYPEMCNQLVIVNSGPDFNNPNSSGVDILAERTKVIKENGFLSLAEKISEGMFPEPSQNQWKEDFKNRLITNDEDAYLHTFGELMKWGLGDQITNIKHPTLVIASDNDYTSVDYKKSYVEQMQNANLVVISNSRHGVVLDAADQLNQELLKFLKNG